MGARISKHVGCLSRHDDIVADNNDIVARAWYGAKEAFGMQNRMKPLLPTGGYDLSSHKLPDSELLQLIIVCDGDEAASTAHQLTDDLIPAGTAQGDSAQETAELEAAEASWLKAAAAAVAPAATQLLELDVGKACDAALQPAAAVPQSTTNVATGRQEMPLCANGADHSSRLSPMLPTACATPSPVTSAAAEAAAARSAAAAAAAGCKHASLSAFGSQVAPEISEEDRASTASAAVEARQRVEELFSSVNVAQQQQDKEQALEALAAAASGCCKTVVSEDEKQALRAAGRAAQDAAQSKLASQLQESDAEVQLMDDDSRAQWFQEHACQIAADAMEVSFDDEWSSLSPDILAMVQEIQARR